MAIKTDPRIDAYIAKAAPFAQPILNHLRTLVHHGNPETEETIKWGCPFFTYRGQMFCSMAAFKAHAAFGFHHQGMEKVLAKDLGKQAEAMGFFGRLTSIADLPNDATLLRYIGAAVQLNDSGQPRLAKSKPKPELPVPPDFAAALKKNRKAAAVFTNFAPSHRRDYIEWITEAKREETRVKRLATALEWIADGKHRNWKYENC